MHDVMRAAFFRFSKGREVLYSVFIALLIGLATGFSTYMQGEEATLSVMGSIDTWMFMSFLIVMIFITASTGGDFKNKTIYYEIMSGHRGCDIVLGRLVPSLVFSVLILSVQLISMYSFGIIWGDWGSVLGSTSQILLRWFLLMCNALPFIVFCMMSIYLAKTVVGALALDWLMFLLMQIPLIFVMFEINIQEKFKSFFCVLNMRRIMEESLNFSFCINIIAMGLLKFLIINLVSTWVLKKSDLK